MKKLALGLICLFSFGLLASGCETEVEADEVTTTLLKPSEYCILSGGTYISEINRLTGEEEFFCKCGDLKCGKDVTCVLDDSGESSCGGVGFVFLTQGLCTMRGVEVCADRISKNGEEIGYWTKCDPVTNRWTTEEMCDGQRSCKIYEFNFGSNIMSSQCGDCQNDGVTCINGKRIVK